MICLQLLSQKYKNWQWPALTMICIDNDLNTINLRSEKTDQAFRTLVTFLSTGRLAWSIFLIITLSSKLAFSGKWWSALTMVIETESQTSDTESPTQERESKPNQTLKRIQTESNTNRIEQNRMPLIANESESESEWNHFETILTKSESKLGLQRIESNRIESQTNPLESNPIRIWKPNPNRILTFPVKGIWHNDESF